MTAARLRLDRELAAALVARQFPAWAGLPVRPVTRQGNDNRTFRLGEDLAIRLPRASVYAPQVEKEHLWLPRLAPVLPAAIPRSLALGEPGEGYPWPWSVRVWLPGEPASIAGLDPMALAEDLAVFLAALRRADAHDGPKAGAHSFWRGGPLATYDAETRAALAAVADLDRPAAGRLWRAALAAEWSGTPVWAHGDVSADNLLVERGRLSAVIDFGCCAVGDPACDLVIAWTFFDGAAREAFRAASDLDSAAWARARGWALWKALVTLASPLANETMAVDARRTLQGVLAEA